MMMKRGAPTPPLPYDAEVEYLESTGTQWLITNIKPSVGDVYAVDTTVQYSSTVGSDKWLTGWYFGPSNSSIIGVYLSQIYFTYNLDGNVAKTSSGLYDKNHIQYNFPEGIVINGNVLSSSVAASTPLSVVPSSALYFVGIPIFARYNSYGYGNAIKCKCFSFAILINGVTVFDGIPVRFTNEQGVSEGAMYDRLGVGGMNPDGSPRTDGLYRNRGTGAFLWAEKQ